MSHGNHPIFPGAHRRPHWQAGAAAVIAATGQQAHAADPLGASSRLAQLLTRVEKLLSERYAFDVFAKNSINFGIMVTYRQTWKPRAVPGWRARRARFRSRPRKSGDTPRAR